MEKQQYEYTTNFGGIEYAITVRESDSAKETVNNKLKKILLKDLPVKVCSKGENL